MKALLVMSLLSANVMSAELKWGDRVNVQEAHCEVTSATGHTEFDFVEGEIEAQSVTNSYFGREIKDSYMKPNFGVLSETGEREPLRYGTAFVGFTPRFDSPSKKNFASFQFIIEETATTGSNVYNVTLLGLNFGGFPSVMKTFYTYIGKGSCEVKLLKR